jgi:hypothetical protein
MHNMKLSTLLTALVIAGASFTSTAQEIPRHLELGRSYVQEIKPENNKYDHRGFRWKGDLLTNEHQANGNCVQFITTVLEHGDSPTIKVIKEKTYWSGYVRTDSYFEAIDRELGFKKITKITDVKPGDVMIYITNNLYKRTGWAKRADALNVAMGHAMLVDAAPVKMKLTKPIVPDTEQWIVQVLDSTDLPHGPDDTRVDNKNYAAHRTGVGRGPLRLYTDREGNIMGFANSPAPASLFKSVQELPFIIGRPN